VKRVVMFGHGSLNICSCMNMLMLMHCWVDYPFKSLNVCSPVEVLIQFWK
jgi:hypothetical protein